jgi:hypothetical protein
MNAVDSVFDSLGMSFMNSMAFIPGVRSLMNMSMNGTQVEFVPLGRLLFTRFFGNAGNSFFGF